MVMCPSVSHQTGVTCAKVALRYVDPFILPSAARVVILYFPGIPTPIARIPPRALDAVSDVVAAYFRSVFLSDIRIPLSPLIGGGM